MGQKKETIGIRCSAEEKKELEMAAAAERRSLSNFMLNAAIERMNAHGHQREETPEIEEEKKPRANEESISILKMAKHNFE